MQARCLNQMFHSSKSILHKNAAKKAAAKPRPSTGCNTPAAAALGVDEAPAVVGVDPEPLEPVAEPVAEAEPEVTDGAV